MTDGHMPDALDAVDHAIGAVTNLRRTLGKGTTRQVQSADERQLTKATGLAWFRSQRPALGSSTSSTLAEIDDRYRELTECAERSTTRERYKNLLGDLRSRLVSLRSDLLQAPARSDNPTSVPPDFGPLVSDPTMQGILARRWRETFVCINAGAHLAATVMMGALLEALLLARANSLADKSALFLAKAAPKDKAGNSVSQREWTLANYIDVAHELGWLRQSARDVGVVLRDYRNYIHPAKELSHGVVIEEADTAMFWVLFQSLAKQVIDSV